MNSTRLPGKVLAKICNKALIEHIYERMCLCTQLDKIVFAIPDNVRNHDLSEFLKKRGIEFFAGSEINVLERYYLCAKQYKADFIVRATGDNPLVDYNTTDLLIMHALKNSTDYITSKGLPLGCATEVISSLGLEKAYHEATNDYDKEHVCTYLINHPKEFKIVYLDAKGIFNKPQYRLTVDTKDDLKIINKIYERLYTEQKPIALDAVINFLENYPHIFREK